MARVNEKISVRRALSLHWWAARVWWGIEPKLFLSTGLSAVTDTVLPYVTVWFSAQIINELAGEGNPKVLWKLVVMTLAVTGGITFLSVVLKHWKQAVHAIEGKLEERFFHEKLLKMDYACVEATSTKDILYEMRYHCMGNMYGFVKIHDSYFQHLVTGVSSILGAAALLWSFFSMPVPQNGRLLWLNHPVFSVLLIFALVMGIVLSQIMYAKLNQHFNDKIFPRWNMYNRYANAFGTMGFKKSRQPDVRIYNQQDLAWRAMEKHNSCVAGSEGAKQYTPIAVFYAAGTMISKALIGIAYVFVGLKAWAGAFGIGSVTQYVGAITAVCSGLTGIFLVITDICMNAGYLDAIKKYMEIPDSMYRGSLTTEKRADRKYEVEFRNVSFRYPDSEVWALKNVSMKFQIGSRLAIVGENGSGKTTFIKLLCRLYDPQEGQILLNGIDIHKYNYEDYTSLFSVVFQDFCLLAQPLGSNVAGQRVYEKERAAKSLMDAGFAERLKELPQGMDTMLYKEFDEEGVDISGGEAQKIAIARALYKDAPFIILDEPTAALDPMAEAEIYAQFPQIAGDKTSIYISHRLSSCRFCEEILVFEDGRIVQRGDHETLLQNTNGKYYTLWNAQAQYYV